MPSLVGIPKTGQELSFLSKALPSSASEYKKKYSIAFKVEGFTISKPETLASN